MRESTVTDPIAATTDWDGLADRVLAGTPPTTEDALAILDCADEELLDLLSAVFRVRRQHFGRSVQLYFLMNAKSGLCPEDCTYCSQSKISKAEIPTYNLLSEKRLLDGAREAHERGSKTYCIVISARGPSDREMRAVTEIVPKIKAAFDLKICACLGLLTDAQASRFEGMRCRPGES